MKKVLLIMLCVVALILTGCGQKDTTDTTANAVATAAPTQTVQTAQAESSDTSEIDLTSMSSTMVYSYVFNMISTPDDFIGQRFRIQGIYDEGLWEPTNQMYHYIIIADATACCAQGMEFVWGDGSHIYPDEYPEENAEIIVEGTFETYSEEGDPNLYCRLSDATLQQVN